MLACVRLDLVLCLGHSICHGVVISQQLLDVGPAHVQCGQIGFSHHSSDRIPLVIGRLVVELAFQTFRDVLTELLANSSDVRTHFLDHVVHVGIGANAANHVVHQGSHAFSRLDVVHQADAEFNSTLRAICHNQIGHQLGHVSRLAPTSITHLVGEVDALV